MSTMIRNLRSARPVKIVLSLTVVLGRARTSDRD